MSARLKLTMPEPLEGNVLTSIRGALHYHPAVAKVFRFNSGAHIAGEGKNRRFIRYHDCTGFSDLWIWLKPRFGTRQAFVEVKRPSKKNGASDEQLAFLAEQKKRGHIAFVAWNAEQALNEFNRQLIDNG